MNREDFIKKLNLFYNNNLQTAEGVGILMNYCADKGKDADLSYKFISTIAMTPYFIHYLKIAVEYYEREFEIVKVYNQNKDKVLLIF